MLRFDHEPTKAEVRAKTGDFETIHRCTVDQITVVTCVGEKRVWTAVGDDCLSD